MNCTVVDQAILDPSVTTNLTEAFNATVNASLPEITHTVLPQMLSAFEPLLGGGYVQNSMNFFLFGTVLETGRRLWQWLMDRFTGGAS